MNKYISIFLVLIISVLFNNAIAQKSETLLDHYVNEYRTFKEFIAKSMEFKGDTNIDVKFYYLDIFIGIESPFISGNVTCIFEPVTENLETIRFDLNRSLTVDSITAPCESFYQDGDEIVINLDDTYNPGDQLEIKTFYHGIPVLAGGYKGL
ncbi:MAG: hypothetical protein JW731_07110 [Bacteroidales bacterium]|nr:hypothetical protein [Bacteroidales bacterium]